MSPFYTGDDVATGTMCIKCTVDQEEHIIKTGMTPAQAEELERLLNRAFLFGIAVAKVKGARK